MYGTNGVSGYRHARSRVRLPSKGSTRLTVCGARAPLPWHVKADQRGTPRFDVCPVSGDA
ncbi:hypothetical protein DSI35_14780 [Mycobacterium tuberculosis]|uniref:Uncharacterized protein n=2 Tax=Mycobacterium tuberculosis TaxID=1773 RepID=A0AB73YII1_MYCTX|nr:hypothetical protein C0092_07000 [Mycobacterium tuberculosis]AVK89536.1 hypothetical protein C1D11_07055 [Mycobacterium tuberculosis variant bovis]AYP11692.1 hypothetical protein EBQ37_07480 [Mycobacterium tuberculosis variant bovis BCG]RAM25771.1 hypothetical protein C8E19_007215 [Mycobacterium tuberculosis variant pinnipedii]WJH71393.1 hypothetical protein FF951_06960 [Mycobacterium tuberculosis complex sp. N0052]WJH75513.1 hypothetical protein FF952_07005 [Mycobacterium tuberculosis comp